NEMGVPSLSFLQSYAGIQRLAERISAIQLADADKKPVEYKRLQTGEYLAEHRFAWFRYVVDLKQSANAFSYAHASWLKADGGMLALDDLLPQPTNKLRVRLTLELPRGWQFISNEDRPGEDVLKVSDAQRAVVFVGKQWRVQPIAGTTSKMILGGDLQVGDAAISEDAAAVYKEYVRLFGSAAVGVQPQIAIIRLPSMMAGTWEAETRGSTVTIVTSGGLSPSDAEQRLDKQLRHELFHLWLPNGVNLAGNYDWFYEGFAVYEEQKLGVAMNQIRFEDFLGTLGRAYDIDRWTNPQRSLIEVSQDRWSGASGQVYARGMLVAFLCDVGLLDSSKGKRSVETLLRQIFDEHKAASAAVSGNDAIIALLRSQPEIASIVDDYVSGSRAIDWAPILKPAGIQATARDQLTQLSVAVKLNGRQKTLLDKLGYNNWRKLAPK
ncbi:MAG: hypothetical protein ACJ73D_12295, partial [Pyrinomonadaceae bacterium]